MDLNEKRLERYQLIYGNNVRKLDEEVVHIPEPRENQTPVVTNKQTKQKKKRVSSYVKRNREKAMEFNASYTVVLTVALTAIVIICIAYLTGQNKLNTQINLITSKQKELAAIVNENHAKKANLEKSIDLEEIRDFAINSLGLQEPTQSQIIYYDGVNADYVKQYEQVPESD
ncbi:MAG: hypothetical protein ACI4F9_11330 [Lachnospiraceae bacterium]